MPPLSLRDFSLGLNDKDDAYMIDQRQLAAVQNAIIERGVISKRHGFKKYTPVAINAIHKLYDFYKSDGTKEFLAVSNLSLYKDTSGTLGAITGALTSNSVQILTYKNRSLQDVVLLADGGGLKVYNGTNVSAVTAHTPTAPESTDPGSNDLVNLTKFRAIAIKKDRIFAAAHATVKNRLSFCHRDPTLGYAVYDYWPATFFFDVATDENDEIVQLKVFRDAIIIFCKRSVWILTGDGRTITDYTLHRINVPSGCIAPDSVVEVGNFIFYLSDDHVYSLFSTDQNYVSAEPVNVNIESTLKAISKSDKEKARGYYFDNKYYLSFPDGTCLVFDTLLKAWTEWTNVQANSFLNRDGVLFFANNNGLIYQFDETIYNDDGTAIAFSMSTKNMDFGADINPKELRRMWVVNKQYPSTASTFTLQAVIDYNTYIITNNAEQPLVWGQGNWGSTLWGFVDVLQNEVDFRDLSDVNSKGKTVQFIISNTVLDQPISIYGLIVEYKLRKAR